jgi:predicted nucleotide-binding protein (sugar kinase/HSP70/actin superfamily)
LAAVFEVCGVPAKGLPEFDARSLELGRRHTSGKEDYTCTLTPGDMLKVIIDLGEDPKKVVFFMPDGTGSCRFGQYHRYCRLILDELGFEDTSVYAPQTSRRFFIRS